MDDVNQAAVALVMANWFKNIQQDTKLTKSDS